MNNNMSFVYYLMRMRHVVWIGAIWVLAGCGTEVTTYYVATTGADTAAGTKEHPFGSLAAVKRAVAADKTTGNTGRFDVVMLPGTYFLSEPLVFRPEESGTADAPYMIRAAEAGTVVLSAGIPLQLTWQKHHDHVWKAHVPVLDSIEGLYAGGKALARARYPNREEGVYPFGGYAADAMAPDRVANWANPEGGYIHAMHSGRWGGMHYRITGKDATGTLTYVGGWQNNRPSAMHPTQRFVENIAEELDAPGEWYFDRTDRMLYYLPEEGEQVDKMDFIAAKLESIIALKGDEDNPVTDIFFEGLTFQHTVPTFMKTREQLMRSDWAIYRSGAVLFDGRLLLAVWRNQGINHMELRLE